MSHGVGAQERLSLPLVVIVGPTASGKTALAIEVAKKFDGEIICADSRTIFKGMDIGTAKPTPAEQTAAPHWGLDLVNPGESFSAADFKSYAQQKIAEIRSRGKIPFLVGGTGLYVDAVVFDYQFGAKVDLELRQKLEKRTIEQLQEYCHKNNLKLPENKLNRRFVMRAIEQSGINTSRRAQPIDNCIIVGIATEKSTLLARIASRTEQLFEDGVVQEATLLGEIYGWEGQAMSGNIYPLINRYLKHGATLAEIKEKFTTLDWRLAKRQLTWLRRNQFIEWLAPHEAGQYLADHLVNRPKS